MAAVATTLDAKIFFQLPEEADARILHPCQVLGIDGEIRTVGASESLCCLEPGESALVYFEQRREFMQQAVVVRSLEESEDGEGLTLELEFVGKPVSAEQRQCYRVCSIGADISATLGEEQGCEVVDVSTTGFALYATQVYRVGDIVEATLHHGGQAFSGRVSVQSRRYLSPTQVRYGVRSLDENAKGPSLHRSLPRISAAIQREQLRRL